MKGWSEIGFGPGTLCANAQSLANEVAPFGYKSNASLGRELAAARPGGALSQASNSPAVCQGWGPGPQATCAHRGTPQGLPVTAEGASPPPAGSTAAAVPWLRACARGQRDPMALAIHAAVGTAVHLRKEARVTHSLLSDSLASAT